MKSRLYIISTLLLAQVIYAMTLRAESPMATKSALGNPTLSAKMEELAQQEARLMKEISVQAQAPSKIADEIPKALASEKVLLPTGTEKVTQPLSAPEDAGPQGLARSENLKEELEAKPERPSKVGGSDQGSTDLLLSIQNTNISLTKKLKEKEARVEVLEHQLDQLRNRLIVAETEKERLSKQLDSSHYHDIVGGPAPRIQPQAPVRQVVVQPVRRVAPPQPISEPDLPIVTVTADKAALRTGPGIENSPLLHVSKGTTLTVETRSGNWYRVNTPQGTRAWISGDIVRFGKENSQPNSQLKNGAIDTGLEDKVYEAVKSNDAR